MAGTLGSTHGSTKYDGLTLKIIEIVELFGPIGPTDIVKLANCESNYAVCWGILHALCELNKIERLDNGLYIIIARGC